MKGWSKIALALGGGAARGLAHLGVIKVLEREKIPVSLIVGTSIGALVGGVYACLKDPAAAEERFLNFSRSREFRRSSFDFLKESKEPQPGILYNLKTWFKKGIFFGSSITKTSFISAEHFEHNINSLLEDIEIQETRVPFVAVASCLETGEDLILREGSLRRAVSASCAVPGVLPPVELDGKTLIDGGWLNKIPVLPALQMGAQAVIGVDVSPDLEDTQEFRKGYDIMIRANAIRSEALKNLQCRFADILIEPRVGHIHWADFSAVEECLRCGEEAAEKALPSIRKLLRRRRFTALFDPFRSRRLNCIEPLAPKTAPAAGLASRD